MSLTKLLKYEYNSCLDIGSNTGQFAKEILENKNIRVVCVEPNSYCASKLRKITNEIYICGLGNKTEKTNLLIPSNKRISKASSFFLHANKTGDNDTLEVEVEVVCGDDLFKDDQFDLIKIDTQGYEYFVIDGARNLISKAKYVLIEFQTKLTNRGAPESIESVKLLEELGFRILDLIYVNNSNHLANFNSVHLDILFEKRDDHNYSCLGEYKKYLEIK